MTDPAAQRERNVIRAFVDLSAELADDYDMLEMLSRLTTNCAEILNIASAGLLLANERGVLHLAAASSERTQQLELYQLQRDQGPCLDCYRDGVHVTAPDLAAERQRWPQFADVALDAGFKSVHAVPMRLRGQILGGLGLFGEGVGTLGDEDVGLAQALAHVACVAIVNERSAADRATVNAQLQRALTSRILLEQAKGVLAHSGGLEIDDAFTVLRGYARAHGRKLGDVAREVVHRELHAEALLQHATRSLPDSLGGC